LSESGTLYQQDDGRWALRESPDGLGLPQSVREVVGRRVERLGGAVVQTLSIAAVIGRDFDADLLERVTDHSEDELLALLAAPDEALRWFTQALELYGQLQEDDAAARCDLLIGLGEAQRQVGEPAFRETLLEAAHVADRAGDADRMARAALANNRGYVSTFGE